MSYMLNIHCIMFLVIHYVDKFHLQFDMRLKYYHCILIVLIYLALIHLI